MQILIPPQAPPTIATVIMKVLACLVIAFYATGSGATTLPKKIQFGTYVVYETSFRERSTTGIALYTKLLFNSINARLPFAVNETQIELVLVGMKEVSNNTVAGVPNTFGNMHISIMEEPLHLYLKKEFDQDIQNADIVLYFSGATFGLYIPGKESYNGWSASGTICTPNKGVAFGVHDPNFSGMESIMFGILRLLGSGETGGVAANLKTKCMSCLTKKPVGVCSNVTELPGEVLNGTAYCRGYTHNDDAPSFCQTFGDGCGLTCCWEEASISSSAPDGFGCGKKKKICFMGKCVPRSFLNRKCSTKKPKKP
ncbi:uncharacterized protein LOC135370185 [Ornithodoros turicata]|uniref:uncharacterized protein LOC135370185 n=1 Tax=Ornithodoros turicata TaxID=34597 RepID=UPI00313916F0